MFWYHVSHCSIAWISCGILKRNLPLIHILIKQGSTNKWFLVPVIRSARRRGSAATGAGCPSPVPWGQAAWARQAALWCMDIYRFKWKKVKQAPPKKMHTEQPGWGSGQYQGNNPSNMLVMVVWLMLPCTSTMSCIPTQSQRCSC